MISLIKVFLVLFGCFALAIFTHQIYLFVVSGECLIAVRNKRVNMPRSCFDIGDICIAVNNYDTLPDCNTLVADEFVPWLSLHPEQPLAKFGICQLYSKRTGEIYLYGHPNYDKSLERYDKDTGEGTSYIFVTTTAVREGPKGVYHGYKYMYGEERWVVNWCGRDRLVESPVPPIPGCIFFYSEKKEIIYFPEEIIPILKAYYPNVKVPEELILRDKSNATDIHRKETVTSLK